MSSDSADVVGYEVYIGPRPLEYDEMVYVPAPAGVGPGSVLSAVLAFPIDRDSFLALRAFNGVQYSSLSNTIRVPAVVSGSGSGAAPGVRARRAAVLAGGGSGAGGAATSSPSAAATNEARSAPPRETSHSETGTGDGSDAAPASTVDTSDMGSIELRGSQYLGSVSARPIGVAEQATLSLWLRPLLDYAPTRTLIDVSPDPGSHGSPITVELIDGEDLLLTIHEPDGGAAYQALYELAPASDVWQHLAVVYDPEIDSDPRVYLDLGPCTLLHSEWSGAALALVQAEGRLQLGGTSDAAAIGYVGRIGHAAIWSEALPLGALETIHSAGHEIDLRTELGDYQSSDALVHYWRFGDPLDPLGYDLGRSDAPIDLDDVEGGVVLEDIVADGPERLLDP